jgi:CopG family nickel-responsive transcriptional regulator
MPVARVGISIEPELLKELDRITRDGGYSNRSQALRDLIRSALSDRAWQSSSGSVLAAVTIFYDSASSFATRRILEMQHDFYKDIRSSTHFHISETRCLEVLVVSGKAARIDSLVKALKSVKGVLHADVILVSRMPR